MRLSRGLRRGLPNSESPVILARAQSTVLVLCPGASPPQILSPSLTPQLPTVASVTLPNSRSHMTSFWHARASDGEGNGNPLQCSCLENPRDRGAWWAAVYGVAQSRTRLERLSSSSRASKTGLPTVVLVPHACFTPRGQPIHLPNHFLIQRSSRCF